MKCVICKEPCECRYGHNASPIKNGSCCNVCNDRCVIPARLRLAFAMMSEQAEGKEKDGLEQNRPDTGDGATP
jgi:hypothetical protein